MTGIVTQSLESLRGVGPKLAEKLRSYGITSVEDLLFHLPLRYQDRTRVTPLGALQDGAEVVIEGEIALVSVTGGGRRRSLLVKLQDGTGLATLRFFHFSQAQKNALQTGDSLRCFGTVRRRPGQQPELIHPEYRRAAWDSADEDTLTPIYPGTEGISQSQWRKLCSQALALLRATPPREFLSGDEASYSLVDALQFLHAPPPEADQNALREGRHPAQLRLATEELVAHQLSLRELRRQNRERPAPVLTDAADLLTPFLAGLPFEPTRAQSRVMQEIRADLEQAKPMLRLVQGDVGSGKTVVAAAAALLAIGSGYQVAVMAPTELLAEQHRRNFAQWFDALTIEQAWLAGSVKGRRREETLAAIADGSARLIIGTHALFQEGVNFQRLGLVIVDEQHRFGVHQRLALSEKSGDGQRAHQLIMTATPIPRTLSMVAYADLDCSVIDELPPGRQPVTTVLIDNQRRGEVIDRVANACRQGRQVYWVCTLIEDSDALQAQAAESTFEELVAALEGIPVALVHGRMKAREKDSVMSDRRKRLVAYHEAGHALVGALMPDYDPVQKISIIPRGNAGGLTFFTPSEERMESGLYSRTYLQNQMAVALGGRVAEEIVYGEDEVTTGASNDLQQVASTARQMITRFGMSDKLGPVALGRSQGGMFLGRDIAAERDFSEDTAATIDEEVSDLVALAYKRATKVLVDNRSVLDELADMLVDQETVDAEEFQELLIRSDVRIAEYV